MLYQGFVAIDSEDDEPDGEVVELDEARAEQFLDHLASDPFVCLVFTKKGELRIFSKELRPEQLEALQAKLDQLREDA